jgi:hypothetical protein
VGVLRTTTTPRLPSSLRRYYKFEV